MDLTIRDDATADADSIAASAGERTQERCDPRLSRDARRARLLACARGMRASGVRRRSSTRWWSSWWRSCWSPRAVSRRPQGDGVADGFTRQVARALCLVSAGDCDRELEPCVVGTGTWARQAAGTVVVAAPRHRPDGHHRGALRRDDVGDLRRGRRGWPRPRRRRRRARRAQSGWAATLAATVLARSGDGAVWELADARQAPALLERLRRGRWAVGEPAPTATFDESGWSVGLSGAVGGDGPGRARADRGRHLRRSPRALQRAADVLRAPRERPRRHGDAARHRRQRQRPRARRSTPSRSTRRPPGRPRRPASRAASGARPTCPSSSSRRPACCPCRRAATGPGSPRPTST